MRLWRTRHQNCRPGELFVARGQRVIDIVAALILIVIVALAVAGVVGIAHVVVWAWVTGTPWYIRGAAALCVIAVVAVGIAGIKGVLDL